MRKIAIYGKGGIGKSTTSANLSVSLGLLGNKVIQIGCDPKHDSTRTIAGKFLPTVLDKWKADDQNITNLDIDRDSVIYKGYADVDCVEAGGPEPGVGCAGRGIIRMMEILDQLEVFENTYDFYVFDVLGDVVCGGFAKPIQVGHCDEVYIVTSGEFMSLYAANNIAIAVQKVGIKRGVKLGGIICNSRALEKERELVEIFAERINTQMIHFVKRDRLIQKWERRSKTVVEGAPESEIAKEYSVLAQKIVANKNLTIPTPLSFEELVDLCEQYDKAEMNE